MKQTAEEKFEAKLKALQERIKKTVVQLKQSHIDDSTPGTVKECPVALAFTAAFKGRIHCTQTAVYPSSHELKATFEGLNGDVEVICELPARAKNLADNWDNDEKVKPMTFRISKILEVKQ